MDAPRLAVLIASLLLLGVAGCTSGPSPSHPSLRDYRSAPQEPLPRPGRAPQEPQSRETVVADENPEPISGWTTGVTMGLGYRLMKSRVQDAEQSMGTMVFEVATRPTGWVLGGELGLSFGESSRLARFSFNDELVNRVYELYVGPRLTIGLGEGSELFFGGGGSVTWFMAEAEDDNGNIASDNAIDPGLYGHGGLLLTLGEMEWLVDVRIAGDIEMTLFGEPLDLSYWQVAVGSRVSF